MLPSTATSVQPPRIFVPVRNVFAVVVVPLRVVVFYVIVVLVDFSVAVAPTVQLAVTKWRVHEQ